MFGLQEQIPDEQYPHSHERSPVCSWWLTWLASLSFVMERMGFSTKRAAVWFLGHDSKPRFHVLLWPSRGNFGHFWLQTLANTCFCCCLSVGSRGANFAEICHMSKSSIRIHWFVAYEKSNLLALSKMVLCQSSLTILQTFSISPVWSVEGCR
jgi:hypothetical protein